MKTRKTKKIVTLLAGMLLITFAGYSQQAFIKFKNMEGKFGYMTSTGKEVVAPVYEEINDLDVTGTDESIVLAKLNGKWGYIDLTGKNKVGFKYDNYLKVSYPEQYVAHVGPNGLMIKVKDKKYGLFDKNGTNIIPYKFDELRFENNHIYAVNADKRGLLDFSGKVLVPVKYDMLDDGDAKTSEIAIVGLNDTKKIFNIKLGKEFDLTESDEAEIKGDLVKIESGGQYGVVNGNGKIVVPVKYNEIAILEKGYIKIFSGDYEGYFGLLDKSGKVIIPQKYDRMGEISDGMISVGKISSKPSNDEFSQRYDYGYYNVSGKPVIPLKYDNTHSFHENLAGVKLGGKWVFIDKTGKTVIKTDYDDISDFEGGSAIVEKDGKYALINKSGKRITDFYDVIEDKVNSGLRKVQQGGDWGYINTKGEVVVPIKFESLDYFHESGGGVTHARINGKNIFIDMKGNRVNQNAYW
ncbi:MAG: WG repeat-containing protein [Chitinophagales bacterium]|nr:WG repeat-containing protein [Chitinophagales bacterium]